MGVRSLFCVSSRGHFLRHGVAILCLWVVFASIAQAQAIDVQILASDENSVTLQLTTPEYRVEVIPDTEDSWYQVTLPGMAIHRVLGQPALPQHGVLVGTPQDVHLTLTVLDASYQTITDRAIAPTISRKQSDIPLWQRFDQNKDQRLYSQNTLFPILPVSIGFQGQLRDQPVAQILFHPVQYHPLDHSLRVYKTLKVRVEFDRPLVTENISTRTLQSVSVTDGDKGLTRNPFDSLIRDSLINGSMVRPE